MAIEIKAGQRLVVAANSASLLKSIVHLMLWPDATTRPDHSLDGPAMWVKGRMGEPQLAFNAEQLKQVAMLLGRLPQATLDIAMVARGQFVVTLNETGAADREPSATQASGPSVSVLKHVLSSLQGDLQAKYHEHAGEAVADFQGPSAAIGAKAKLPLSFTAAEAKAAATTLARAPSVVIHLMALGSGHTSVTMTEDVSSAELDDDELYTLDV